MTYRLSEALVSRGGLVNKIKIYLLSLKSNYNQFFLLKKKQHI